MSTQSELYYRVAQRLAAGYSSNLISLVSFVFFVVIFLSRYNLLSLCENVECRMSHFLPRGKWVLGKAAKRSRRTFHHTFDRESWQRGPMDDLERFQSS